MNTAVLFSSATDEWETPQAFFDAIDLEFGFDWDVAASRENHKCQSWLGPTHFVEWSRDALSVAWCDLPCDHSPVVWCNPPYSRGLQRKFIAKAAAERLKGVTTVMLIPARTDTKAFHEHIYDASKWQARDGIEIRLLPGRLSLAGRRTPRPSRRCW